MVVSGLSSGTMRPAPGGEGAGLTRVQITKHVTRDRVLDIGDMLAVEPRRSKISLTLVEFDPESHRANARVRHYVDADDFKRVCFDLLHDRLTSWTDYKGTAYDGGPAQARVLSIHKDTKLRQPYVLTIDNGIGEVMPGGAVKMAQTTDSLTLLLSEVEARTLALTVYDYIRDFETVYFRQRREAQTVLLPAPDPAEVPAPTLEPSRPESVRRRGRSATS
jgi:hypothetical protein